MSDRNNENIVAVVRNNGEIFWYRSPSELWILDYIKWKQDFEKQGYTIPETYKELRGGISIVDETTKNEFLDFMRPYLVQQDELSKELAMRYQTADSWWSVRDLFPVIFVDFDDQSVGVFYIPGDTPLERYVPENWSNEYIDFANEYSEEKFPEENKFWIKKGSDLLKLLIERGAKLKK